MFHHTVFVFSRNIKLFQALRRGENCYLWNEYCEILKTSFMKKCNFYSNVGNNLLYKLSLFFKNVYCFRGAWVAQSIERLTSAHVRISQSTGLSPTSGCQHRAWTLLRILCLPLTVFLPHSRSLSIKKWINLKKKF